MRFSQGNSNLQSASYSAGLSDYADKGVLGLPETHESQADWELKTRQLADLIRQPGARVVVHTGAGISTAAGIPDFRGPNGVWTLERDGRTGQSGVRFEEAQPTLTHAALVALETAGFIHYLVTQNVDGLHLRSGFPRNRMSILHGDVFIERCRRCGLHRSRRLPGETVGQKPTGRLCEAPARRAGRNKQQQQQQQQTGLGDSQMCGGEILDTVLDWEHQLPQADLRRARENSSAATVNLTLGSSLQIVPAADLPTMGGRLVIVNLQTTKKDSQSYLRINARSDLVMRLLCQELLGVDADEMLRPLLHLQPLKLYSKHTKKSERFPWRFAPCDENSVENSNSNPELSRVKTELKDSSEISAVKREEQSLESNNRTNVSQDRTTDSQDRTTDSKDRTTDSKDRTTDSKDRTTDSEDRTTESEDRTTENKDRTTDSQDRTTNIKRVKLG